MQLKNLKKEQELLGLGDLQTWTRVSDPNALLENLATRPYSLVAALTPMPFSPQILCTNSFTQSPSPFIYSFAQIFLQRMITRQTC